MGNLRAVIRRLFDRRKVDTPVATERRHGKMKIQEADKRLRDVVDKLEERTVRMRREDFLKFSANDSQQVVVFSSFQEICSWTGPQLGKIRLCRHDQHPDAANSQTAICEESKCPIMNPALRGAA